MLVVFGSFWVFRGFLAGTAVQLAGRACSPAGRQDTDGMCRARSPGVPGGGCPPVGQEARAPSAPAKKNLSRASSRRCRARMVFPPLSLTAQGLFFSGGWPQAGLGAVRAPRCLLLPPTAPKKCPLRGTAPGCGAGRGHGPGHGVQWDVQGCGARAHLTLLPSLPSALWAPRDGERCPEPHGGTQWLSRVLLWWFQRQGWVLDVLGLKLQHSGSCPRECPHGAALASAPL